MTFRVGLVRQFSLLIGIWGIVFCGALIGHGLLLGRNSLSREEPHDLVGYAANVLADGRIVQFNLLLPWVVICCVALSARYSPIVLLRSSSRFGFVIRELRVSILPTLVVGLLAAVVCAAVLGVGLPLAVGNAGEVFGAVTTLVAQLAMLALAAIVVYLGLSVALVWTGSAVAMAAIAGLGFIAIMAASLLSVFVEWPILQLANFAYALRSPDPIATASSLGVAVALFGLVFATAIVARDRITVRATTRNVVTAVALVGVCAWILASARAAATAGAPFWQALVEVFFGVGPHGWSLGTYGSIVLIGLVPVFVSVLRFESTVRDWLPYLAIRRGGMGRWMASFLARVVALNVAVIVILCALTVVAFAAVGGFATGSSGDGEPVDVGRLFYQLLVNGMLQAAVVVVVTFSVVWVTGATESVLVALGAFVAAGAINPVVGGILPSMLGSLGYLELGWTGILRITLILVAALALALAANVIVLRRLPISK